MTNKMQIHPTAWTGVVPAGRYVIGDPCHFVQPEVWKVLLDKSNSFRKPVGEFPGEDVMYEVLAFGTAHGDGTYGCKPSKRSRDEKPISVDSGLIGLVPLDLAKGPWGRPENIDDDGVAIFFTRPARVSCDGGIMDFGGVYIDTTVSFHDEDTDSEDEINGK